MLGTVAKYECDEVFVFVDGNLDDMPVVEEALAAALADNYGVFVRAVRVPHEIL